MNPHGDKLRREAKLKTRMRRAESASSYTTSPPPMSVSHVSSAIQLPIYSILSSMPLLAEAGPGVQSQTFIPPYNSTLEEPPYHSQVFASALFQQPISSSYNVSMEYAALYSEPSDYKSADSYHLPQSPFSSLAVDNSVRNTSLGIPHDGESNMMACAPVPDDEATIASTESAQEVSHVRVVQGRPKPRCWDHGCNGRQFSTFSNLLRHQREKSGQAVKAKCPNCGAEFTRTTARNGHLLHEKCKQRRST